MKLTLTRDDGTLLAQFDLEEYGDLTRPMPQSALIEELLEQIRDESNFQEYWRRHREGEI